MNKEKDKLKEKLHENWDLIENAIIYGWYYIDRKTKIINFTERSKSVKICALGIVLECIDYNGERLMFKLKDNKKYWALTRKELENELQKRA